MRYTQEQISTALVLLKATGSPDKVVQTLGYPSAPMLYHWRKKYPEYYDVPNQKHRRQAPTELKHDVHIPQELRIRSRGTERCSASN